MTLQVENTARCCGAVSRGEVDVAVVGGTIPADLEHLLQVLLAVTHTASTRVPVGTNKVHDASHVSTRR